jgi:hypothetical protein
MAELAKGRILFMLDTKPPDHGDAFYGELEQALADNQLLGSAYVIGTPESRRRFLGKSRVGVDRNTLREQHRLGSEVRRLYFLFEHGRELDAETVRFAQDLGVPVVPSINIFHYDDLPDHMAAAQRDVQRMLELDVDEFQIDSPYDVWLL